MRTLGHWDLPAQGPRPTTLELALDDLKLLLPIALRHEPGSYRASGTIAELELIVAMQNQQALSVVESLGLREGDKDFWEALHQAKQGVSLEVIARHMKDLP